MPWEKKLVLFNDTTRAHWLINHQLLDVKHLVILTRNHQRKPATFFLMQQGIFYMHFSRQESTYHDLWSVVVHWLQWEKNPISWMNPPRCFDPATQAPHVSTQPTVKSRPSDNAMTAGINHRYFLHTSFLLCL